MIYNIKVDNVTMSEVLESIENVLHKGQRGIIVSVNPSRFLLALRNQKYRDVINSSFIALPDGIGIVWAAKFLGFPLRERVTASDLVYKLAMLSSNKGYTIFILGACDGVAQKAVAALQQLYPTSNFIGYYHGYFEKDSLEEEEIITQIRYLQPDILLVALGAPMEELWIQKHFGELGVPICVGVGGAIDFASYRVKRAPVSLQKVGLEWFYRLSKEPKRMWKRCLVEIPVFILKVLVFKSSIMLHQQRVIQRTKGKLEPGS